jgi:hypothetical protein
MPVFPPAAWAPTNAQNAGGFDLMSWIKSYIDLPDHPKTLHLKRLLGLDIDQTIGKLHRLWYWARRYAEDGDLRPFGLQQVNAVLGLPRASKALVTTKLLDRRPYLRIHDWWDYAGAALQAKYKRTPDKWIRIKCLYECRVYRSKDSYVPGTQPLRNSKERVERVDTSTTKETGPLGSDGSLRSTGAAARAANNHDKAASDEAEFQKLLKSNPRRPI